MRLFVAIVAALVLLAGCASAPRTWQAAPVIFPATPSPYVAETSSLCARADSAAPNDWLAAVCPAADRLAAAQAGLQTLLRAAKAGQQNECISQAAYSAQELAAVERDLARVPTWTPGAVVVSNLNDALSTYKLAIDDLRDAYAPDDTAPYNDGKRLVDSGDRIVKLVRQMLGGTLNVPVSVSKYKEFLEHSILARKQAYDWFEELRVANNLVNNLDALDTAENLAHWAQSERDWLGQRQTDPCYQTMKQHYLAWIINPAYDVGEAYTRWSKLWPYDDRALWATVTNAVNRFGDGYRKYAAELKSPSQTCVTATPSPTP